MAYTTPKTWSNEPLVASDLNTHLRDNMEALKDPPSANYEVDEASDYTTTSTSFVDVDATNLSLTIETKGGDVLVHFHAVVSVNSTVAKVYFEIDVDGSPVAGDDGIYAIDSVNSNRLYGVVFSRLIPGLSAGSHTFKLQWKVSVATATLYAGAGTSGLDLHPQFWAREVS